MFIVYGVHVEYGAREREVFAEFDTEEEAMDFVRHTEAYANDPYYVYYGVEEERS